MLYGYLQYLAAILASSMTLEWQLKYLCGQDKPTVEQSTMKAHAAMKTKKDHCLIVTADSCEYITMNLSHDGSGIL